MKRWLWAVWWGILAVWTVGLTTAFPVRIHQAILPTDPFGVPVGKVLHVTAYAFLAGYAVLMRPAGVWRWLILLLLLEHGVATEWIQRLRPRAHVVGQRHRHRSLRRGPGRAVDVAVAAGAGLTTVGLATRTASEAAGAGNAAFTAG